MQWDVQNVDQIYFNGSPVTGKETRQVCPAQTTTYTLRVLSGTGATEYPLIIQVSAAGQTPIQFSADSYQVVKGQCTTLRWNVTGVQAVFLNGGGVNGVGSQEVCPQDNTTYELRVQDTSGVVTTKSLTIEAVPADQAIVYFWAGQYALPSGACTTLYWDVQNVKEVYLEETGVSGSGSKPACPSQSQYYSLRVVDNNDESIERQISITVSDPALAPAEVIARGVINNVARADDVDATMADDQAGYWLTVDGISPLFKGTDGWTQAVVKLGVPDSEISPPDSIEILVEWPIRPGQQVEFRAICNGADCMIDTGQGSYLLRRSR